MDSKAPWQTLRDCLVHPNKIIWSPLHIKLGVMKQYVKVFGRDGDYYIHFSIKFSVLSEAKIKEAILLGPQFKTVATYKQF